MEGVGSAFNAAKSAGGAYGSLKCRICAADESGAGRITAGTHERGIRVRHRYLPHTPSNARK